MIILICVYAPLYIWWTQLFTQERSACRHCSWVLLTMVFIPFRQSANNYPVAPVCTSVTSWLHYLSQYLPILSWRWTSFPHMKYSLIAKGNKLCWLCVCTQEFVCMAVCTYYVLNIKKVQSFIQVMCVCVL